MPWLVWNILYCIALIFWKTWLLQSFLKIFLQFKPIFRHWKKIYCIKKLWENPTVLRFFKWICETQHRTFKMETLRWFKFMKNWLCASWGLSSEYVSRSTEHLKWRHCDGSNLWKTNLRFMRFIQWICETQHRIFQMETSRWFEFMKNWLCALWGLSSEFVRRSTEYLKWRHRDGLKLWKTDCAPWGLSSEFVRRSTEYLK